MNNADLPLAERLQAALAAAARGLPRAPGADAGRTLATTCGACAPSCASNQDALCDAISADYGHRSRHETLLAEIAAGGRRHRPCAPAPARLDEAAAPQRRPAQLPGCRNRVIPQPLGVVGVIVPWNFPVNLSFVPLTYIFAAGNRAMVKMSENSRHLARLLIEQMPAYFPPEKLQFFDETGGVGVEFSQLPFDHLLFTGSGTTGRAVMAAAAQQPVPGDAGTRRQGAGHRVRRLPAAARRPSASCSSSA